MAGGAIGGQMGNDIAAGNKPSFKKAWAAIDKADLAGRAIGSTIGATLGSMLLPGIGSMIGGIVGNFIGGKVVELIRGKKSTNEQTSIRVTGTGATINVTPQASTGDVEQTTDKNNTTVTGNTDVVADKNSSGTDNVKQLQEKMKAAYQKYAQLLAEGKGESAEGQQALQEYKQAFNEYEAYVSGQSGTTTTSTKTSDKNTQK